MEQNNLQNKFDEFNNTPDSTSEFDPQDIEQNKVMAVLAYFGILVLVPILGAPNSKFARFHANQGLILLLACVGLGIALYILNVVILAISWRLWGLASILNILWLAPTVLAIIGIVNAASGKAKELPLIGKYKLLK